MNPTYDFNSDGRVNDKEGDRNWLVNSEWYRHPIVYSEGKLKIERADRQ